MNTINSTNCAFRSSLISTNTKKPLFACLNALKDCNLRSMQNIPVENAYKVLSETSMLTQTPQSGVMLGKGYLRFLGNDLKHDTYIFNQLKKIDNNAVYQKDIPSALI